MNNYVAFFSFGLCFDLPEDAVRDCHHQGACDDDTAHWQSKLNLNLDRVGMIQELLEYGAWGREELDELDNSELEMKMIWLAAGNIQESEEWTSTNL